MLPRYSACCHVTASACQCIPCANVGTATSRDCGECLQLTWSLLLGLLVWLSGLPFGPAAINISLLLNATPVVGLANTCCCSRCFSFVFFLVLQL